MKQSILHLNLVAALMATVCLSQEKAPDRHLSLDQAFPLVAHPDDLRKALEANPELVHETDARGSLLHEAVRLRQYDSAELLLELGADVNVTDHDGNTPLFIAVASDDRDLSCRVLSLLLWDKWGANVNARNAQGRTPLHEAVLKGDSNTVGTLSGYHPNLKIRDNQGQTALDLCRDEKIKRELQYVKSLERPGASLYWRYRSLLNGPGGLVVFFFTCVVGAIGIVLCIWTARDVQKRGNLSVGWVSAVLLFYPISLPIYLWKTGRTKWAILVLEIELAIIIFGICLLVLAMGAIGRLMPHG